MNLNTLKGISTGLTLVAGLVGIVAGIVDKKLMVAEIAKQMAEGSHK